MAKRKHSKKQMFLLEMVFITILMVASLFNSYLNAIVLVISILTVFSSSREDSLCMLLYMISFERIFKLQLGGFALITVVELAFVIRLLYKRRFSLPHRCGLPLVLFLVYLLATGTSAGVVDCIKIILGLLMAALVLDAGKARYSLNRLAEYTSAGLVVSSTVAVFRNYFPNMSVVLGNSRIKLSQGVYYYRFAGLQSNPNYYTVLISVVMAVLVVLFLRGQMKRIDFVYAVALFVFGMMSVSMSYIVALAATGLIAFVILTRDKPKYLILGLGAILIFVIVLYVLRNTSFVSTLIYRLERMQDSDNQTASALTTGRTDTWVKYIEYFVRNPLRLLIGTGLGASTSKLIGNEAHNFFIEVLFYCGIVGSVLYIMLLFTVFHPRRYARGRMTILALIPFITLFVRFMARCLFADEQLPFMYILCTVTAVTCMSDSRTVRTGLARRRTHAVHRV